MKKNIILIAILILIAVIMGFLLRWIIEGLLSLSTDTDKDEGILFEQYESFGEGVWGGKSTILYYSGKLIIQKDTTSYGDIDINYITNIERQLNREDMNKIIEKIKTTKIMRKFCLIRGLIADYGATTIIHVGGRKKTIEYPACEEETGEISKLIYKAYKDQPSNPNEHIVSFAICHEGDVFGEPEFNCQKLLNYTKDCMFINYTNTNNPNCHTSYRCLFSCLPI